MRERGQRPLTCRDKRGGIRSPSPTAHARRAALASQNVEIMERVYDRELDPISASERIFKEV